MFEMTHRAVDQGEVRRMTVRVVEKWIGGWGSVERERLLTGDPSARPQGTFSVVGGKRGSPSDPGSLLEVWGDVEMTLGKNRPLLRAALLHKYRDGARGEEGEELEFDFGGPDFRAFFTVEKWQEMERTFKGCGKSLRWFFGHLVRDFEWELARERGLHKVAHGYVERGIPL